MDAEVTEFIRLCTELRALGAVTVSQGYFSATFAGPATSTLPKPPTVALSTFSATSAPSPATPDEAARKALLEAIADD